MVKQLFIVMGCNDHEASNPVRAFLSNTRATAFAGKCDAYERTAPPCPPIEDTTENDALWNKWSAKRASWEKRHPAKSNYGASYYCAVPVPFESV